MTLVKICGLSTPETMDAALDAGADFVGLVFFEKSPRNVEPQTAAQLASMANLRAKVVALTVDADHALLETIVSKVAPDYLQLQGHETLERVADIRIRYSVPVIKAVGISNSDDLAAARDYFHVADIVLLDAKPPPGAALPGGNGLAFDWQLLAPLKGQLPFMLAGGLTPENVATAIELTGATMVDVSSGVEMSPGVKDPERIRRFLLSAKGVKPASK
jgi:phosphoribosylanthranilate isomerase